MRILFLSAWFPYPADNGSKIRILNILRQLAGDHDVTLLSFAHRSPPPEALTALRSLCRDVRVATHVPFRPTRLRAYLGLLSAQPRSFTDTYSRAMADLVRTASAARPYDLVIASQILMAPYALAVDGAPRLLEELELTTLYDQARQGHWARRARYGLTWHKTARFVRRLLRGFCACTVASAPERALLARVAPGYRPVYVVPNGVDLDAYVGDWGTPEPDTLIHTGALSYRANYDAAAYFLREVFPRIRGRRAALLRITGSLDGLDLSALPATPGVVFTGYLPDIRPAVAQSWLSVVPLRIGGGTRLKILEAMALGTPVVSTAKGAEGLDVRHGESILIGDTPARFADAVLEVLEDPSLRSHLAAGGRRLVAERYSWDRIGAELGTLVREVTGVAS